MKNKLTFIIVLIGVLLIFVGCNATYEDLSESKVGEESNYIVETEEITSISDWIEKNKNTMDSNFDEENKIMYVSKNFGRTSSIEKKITSANYEIYKVTKELEEKFSDEISDYKFSFLADIVDSNGNEKNDVVYSIILNKRELNSVNWENIEPDILVNLASYVYKNPVIQ